MPLGERLDEGFDGDVKEMMARGQRYQSTGEFEAALDPYDRTEYQRHMNMLSLFAPDAVMIWKFASDIIIEVGSWMALAVEVFIRRDFGERYISLLRLWAVWGWMGVWGWLGGLGTLLITGHLPYGMAIFSGLWLITALARRYGIWKRKRTGRRVHSMYLGTTVIPGLKRIGHWWAYTWVEPIVCILVGLVVWQFDVIVGPFIFWSAVALFVKNNFVYHAYNSKMLDIIDGQIMSANLSQAVNGKPPTETQGVLVVPISPAFRRQDTAPTPPVPPLDPRNGKPVLDLSKRP